jgi:hypothetical protein
MDRRTLLKRLATLPLLPAFWPQVSPGGPGRSSFRRIRPGDPSWPGSSRWEALKRQVGGNLFPVEFPLTVCEGAPNSSGCQEVLKNLDNPFYIGDTPGLTQTLGGQTRGPRNPAFTPSPRGVQKTSPQRLILHVTTASAWSSRVEATATRAPRARPIPCWFGHAS